MLKYKHLATNYLTPPPDRVVLHIDFNSYFATIEQQANPRLRGKPIGVTGGDRMSRTVLGAASVEAKKFGVKTGMSIPQALKICPQLILVKGDSDKYLTCTQRFLNILKRFSPYLEVFSIDEVFMELPLDQIQYTSYQPNQYNELSFWSEAIESFKKDIPSKLFTNEMTYPANLLPTHFQYALTVAEEIREQIYRQVGEWVTVSIGISYNKVIAKMAGSMQKPNGLTVILDETAAMNILDTLPLDEICGIGPRIKRHLHTMGIYDFATLRKIPIETLAQSFKSYGYILYNWSRGIDHQRVQPFYEKEEVKSVGHQHTIHHDTADRSELRQILVKLTELIARRLRAKKLIGRTVSCYFRYELVFGQTPEGYPLFESDGRQMTIPLTRDGLDIFSAAWRLFEQIWDGRPVRMMACSISQLQPEIPQNLTFLEDAHRKQTIINTLDKINDRYGEFTLQRAVLLTSKPMRHRPNPFLADYRFKLEKK